MRFFSFIILIIFLIIIPPAGFSAWSFESGVRWFYLFMVSFLFYHILHPFILKISYKYNIMDIPDPRKLHKSPIPRIGGLGIFLSFIFGVLRNFQFSKEIISLLIASCVIFVVGFFDDVKNLSAIRRLFFQILASLIVVFGGIYVRFPLSWGDAGLILSYIVSVLWIVGITNTFNFMDGIDGLAATLSLVISIIFLVIVVNTSQVYVMFITSSLCGSVLGFLFYNWHPAKIFMGDGGSTFLGFILAVTSIYVWWADNNPFVAFSAPIMVLFVPIFDLLYTTVSRIKNGVIKNFYDWLVYAGRDHIHHRILNLGFSTPQTVLIISLLNLVCGFAAINMVVESKEIEFFISAAQIISVFTIIVLFMRRGREDV